ncbi:uncharacterized protein LOC114916611 [Cajanus cajan]|uniref:uncharacterized protein LOC114916611 n=1 Tax=Cajanus cajan TaxID=3821 RepID=UPI0010FB5C18|nr:uncharacterized protein LOC114916611 [Cajanus cajan]
MEDEAFYFGGLPKFPFYWCPKPSRFHGVGQVKVTASEVAAIDNLVALPRPLDCKLVLSLANLAYRERVLESIMGKNLWRELKHRYNVTELEVPEPQEEDVSPLQASQKRKRGAREVGGTSAFAGAEEVASKAADADVVDLTESPPPQVAFEEVAQIVEPTVQAAEVGATAAEVGDQAVEEVARVAEVASILFLGFFVNPFIMLSGRLTWGHFCRQEMPLRRRRRLSSGSPKLLRQGRGSPLWTFWMPSKGRRLLSLLRLVEEVLVMRFLRPRLPLRRRRLSRRRRLPGADIWLTVSGRVFPKCGWTT